jgi:hypothetical protein
MFAGMPSSVNFSISYQSPVEPLPGEICVLQDNQHVELHNCKKALHLLS